MKDRLIVGLGALSGSLVGGLAAYFLSPKNGPALKKDIIYLSEKAGQKAIEGSIKGLKEFESALIKIGPINHFKAK